MINYLSAEKKKNEPLAPAPSPTLKTMSRLFFGFSDWMSTSDVTPFACWMLLKKRGAWTITLTLTSMLRSSGEPTFWPSMSESSRWRDTTLKLSLCSSF